MRASGYKQILMAILLTAGLPWLRAQVDTSTVVYSWKLGAFFADREQVSVDTSLMGFQRSGTPLAGYSSVSWLGNYGLPAISNVFTERDQNEEFILVNTYFPYLKRISSTRYVNTRKPFTNLLYLNGGSSLNKEESLDAFHSQNITRYLNIGMHLTTSRALGQYRFQKVRNNTLRLFSSLDGIRYSYHASFNLNKLVADENGGVLDDASITDTVYSFTKDIPTLFGGTDNPPVHDPDVYNEIGNLGVFTMHQVALGKMTAQGDSATARRKALVPAPRLVYVFHFDRYMKLYRDSDPGVGLASGLYHNILINDEATTDSFRYWKWFNSASLLFEKSQNNLFCIGLSYERMHYMMHTPSDDAAPDTLLRHWFISQPLRLDGVNYHSDIFNTALSSGLSKTFGDKIRLRLSGRTFLAGYRKGDFMLSGEMNMTIGKKGIHMLGIQAANEFRKPDFLYTHYASNHFMWTNNFKAQRLNNLSIKLSLLSKKIELSGDLYLIGEYVFLNDRAVPEQYHSNLPVAVLSASGRLEPGKLVSQSKVVYQHAGNKDVLSLPELVINQSLYFTHMFSFRATGGKLLTMIGFDLVYNSRYYASAYMPALSAFYQQDQKKLGGYPYIDLFLSAQLKRFRFFLTGEHINSNLMERNYFSVLHYPRNPRLIKMGLSWTFYD